ncbi:MAG TPA: hypothetical protein VFN30_05730 [Chitinophagaceae bacterium]|nr:hypothetical protein [Chitinophagaceae bacterium]
MPHQFKNVNMHDAEAGVVYVTDTFSMDEIRFKIRNDPKIL